jgi:GNAT superfamily N-acetyltransferase
MSATATAAAGQREGRAARVRGQLSRRWAWLAACAAAAVLFFLACLRLAGTQPVMSDGASNALQAWQMLHGNPLLHGWWLTDVSFYTTELPQYMLVELVIGLHPEVVHICAALTYTLLVLLAAFVARGRARGAEGAVRALLAAGIMLAPVPGETAWALLLSPNHTGTGVPVLLLLLLLDRAPRRWYTAVAAGVLLAWAVVGDPLMLVVGVLPVVVVCLARAGLAPLHRRAGWYEISLACAAALAVLAADAANRLIVALGGFATSGNPATFMPLPVLRANVPLAVRSFLSLFGADVAGARGTLNEASAIIHLAGAMLVLAAVVLGGWRLVRSLGWRGPAAAADLVADLLVVAIVANIAAYFVLYQIKLVNQAHEIGPVVSLGAALAGRLLGGPLLRARLVPALAAGLACYAVMLGFAAAGQQAPPDNAVVAVWLEQHGLRSGVAPYWEGSSITLDSGGAITMGSVRPAGKGLSPWHWNEDMRIFNPSDHTANFYITVQGESVTPAMARAVFGPPARVYHFQTYTIMVWNKNLLRQLGPAV